MGNMPWAHQEHAGQLQVFVTQYWEEDYKVQIHGNADDRKCDEAN